MTWVSHPTERGFSLRETTAEIVLSDVHVGLEGCDGGGQAEAARSVAGLPLQAAFRLPQQLELALAVHGGDRLRITGRLTNRGDAPCRVERVLLRVGELRLGNGAGPYRVFTNGYQSWTQARSYGPTDSVRVPNLGFARLMQEDLHNLASGKQGELRSEMYTVVGDLAAGCFLVVGQGPSFDQFLHLRMRFERDGAPPTLVLAYELGGQEIPAGESVALDELLLFSGAQVNETLDRYLASVGPLDDSAPAPPAGWCSWYYYFTKVTAADVEENLEEASRHEVDWSYFQLDDGYQRQVGDWLQLNAKYPDGLAPLVSRIEEKGMVAGLWLAPFSARANSQLFRAHPDWFLKDDRGRPALAGWNPMWGVGGRFYGLDTTHPEAQAWLRDVIRTMVHDWGFRYLKLDFVYSAAIYARAHDPRLSPAQRLKLGYQIVREAAGPDVFLLGCGAPLSASIGHVDGMRIGPDVAPFWFPKLRYHVTRDPHALSTCFAIRNTLTRAQMHRRLWQNDPDCLLIRDTETKLNADERQSLTNAIAVSGGMVLLSDRLSRLPASFWPRIERITKLTRACAGGRTWPLDLMEREIPELVYNTAGYLAVFNFLDGPAPKRLRLADHLDGLLPNDATLRDVWDDTTFAVCDGVLDLGTLPAHGSRLLRVAAPPSSQ